jgi:hypothetical protein
MRIIATPRLTHRFRPAQSRRHAPLATSQDLEKPMSLRAKPDAFRADFGLALVEPAIHALAVFTQGDCGLSGGIPAYGEVGRGKGRGSAKRRTMFSTSFAAGFA